MVSKNNQRSSGDVLDAVDPGMCAQGSGPGPRETSSADDGWGSVLRHSFQGLIRAVGLRSELQAGGQQLATDFISP